MLINDLLLQFIPHRQPHFEGIESVCFLLQKIRVRFVEKQIIEFYLVYFIKIQQSAIN